MINKIVVSLLFCMLVTGCMQSISPNSYRASEVGVASDAVPGVIVAKRYVDIDGNSGVGGLAGAVAGGAAGSAIGGSTAASLVGVVGGALIGGLAGNSIDKAVNHKIGIEYIIRLHKGSTISVTQAQDMQFTVNQRVLVIYGPMTRIIPDNRVN
jgi:outer membrane lipoprotein SlyB